MVVRSRRFFTTIITPASTYVSCYVVPAGRTARFSLITAVNFGGSTVNVWLAVTPSGGTRRDIEVANLPNNTSVELARGLVLNPGDELWAFCSVNNGAVVAGAGSLLDGAPT